MLTDIVIYVHENILFHLGCGEYLMRFEKN